MQERGEAVTLGHLLPGGRSCQGECFSTCREWCPGEWGTVCLSPCRAPKGAAERPGPGRELGALTITAQRTHRAELRLGSQDGAEAPGPDGGGLAHTCTGVRDSLTTLTVPSPRGSLRQTPGLLPVLGTCPAQGLDPAVQTLPLRSPCVCDRLSDPYVCVSVLTARVPSVLFHLTGAPASNRTPFSAWTTAPQLPQGRSCLSQVDLRLWFADERSGLC